MQRNRKTQTCHPETRPRIKTHPGLAAKGVKASTFLCLRCKEKTQHGKVK